MMLKRSMCISLICILSSLMIACGGQKKEANEQSATNSTEPKIKPATKLSPDATTHAQLAWRFIQQTEILLQEKKIDMLEGSIRQPIRQLTQDWLTQVKMNDAVTEGKYAMCRKTLQSMDAWARALQENATDVDKKREMYFHDKNLCQDAIEHPELGNTDPKKLVKD